MSNPLRTSGDYELFLYTLTDQFPSDVGLDNTGKPHRGG